MKRIHAILPLFLVVILLVSCAPAAAPLEPSAPSATETSAPSGEAATVVGSGGTDPTPAATSRGPDLEATDPSTVSLASGGLQLVEFFRFT